MNYEVVDTLYRSRVTLLEHLEESGYDTKPFSKFSHKEIQEMVKVSGALTKGAPAFQMELQKKEGAPASDFDNCLVVYTLSRIKQKIDLWTSAILEPIETPKTELIVVTLEPIAPNFHAVAGSFWTNKKVRVRYFQAAAIINNPLKHVLVPKHEKVPKEEEEALLTNLNAKKNQFPLIRFHEDPIARMIGLLPGDIVKITRPSATAGECIMYRVCVP